MIYPSLNYFNLSGAPVTGRTGHIFLTAYNPVDATVIRARSTTGIVEDAIGGAYYLLGGLNASVALTVWDDDATLLGGEMIAENIVTTTIGAALGTINGVTGPGTVFVIKRGDSAPSLPYQAKRVDGAPVDITGSTILFKMRLQPDTGILVVNRPAVIVDGPNGIMKYDWQHSGADTAIAAEYDAEFQVTFPDGSVETFPATDPDTDEAHEYITVKIPPDLD